MPLLHGVERVAAQDDAPADRLPDLGADRGRVAADLLGRSERVARRLVQPRAEGSGALQKIGRGALRGPRAL